MTTTRAVTMEVDVMIPAVPNYLLIENSDAQLLDGFAESSVGEQIARTVDIAHVSDDQLRALASAWTEKFIENANTRRGYPIVARGDDAFYAANERWKTGSGAK